MKYFDANTDIQTVEKAVLRASLKGDFSCLNQHPEGVLRYVVANVLGRRHSDIVCNYPLGILYWGLSEYAIRKGEKMVIEHLNQTSQKYLNDDGVLNYELRVIDQTPMGLCFINMFKATGNEKYFKGALSIANFLLTRYEEDHLMYRKEGEAQLVDTLGLTIPFLVECSNLFHDEKYVSIAKEIYNLFGRNAIDPSTGFPFHGYNVKNNQKLGSANWGRGLGWFLLASAYLNEKPTYKINPADIYMTQFICQDSMLDSSVVLFTELYKIKTINSYIPDWSVLNAVTRTDGMVDFCSGDTNGFNYYANHYGLGGLANGLFLLILALK